MRRRAGIGAIALMIAHVAGMVDLVALPVWIGVLMSHYAIDAQRAGGIVTLFLVGVVLSSAFVGARFDRLPVRSLARMAYGLACACFISLAFVRAPVMLAVLHAGAGACVGCGLSLVHGSFGRFPNPHRMWAIAGLSLGIFAIVFLGGAPLAVQAFGGAALFVLFALLMAAASLASLLAFPRLEAQPVGARTDASATERPGGIGRGEAPAPAVDEAAAIPPIVRFAIVGVVCMSLAQSMLFSFVERIGIERGFGGQRVIFVLVAIGFVNLTPAVLAALLQYRLPARAVAVAGPIAQVVLAFMLTQSTSFAPYAVAASLLVFVMIFAHTFVFGMIAAADPAGRAVALTPAMLMTGSALGPLLGGTLVLHFGFESLGYAVVVTALLGSLSFARFGSGFTPAPPTIPTSPLASPSAGRR